ncbi:MAG: zinc ribbon domain-containing protein [Acidiferrobacterales bacterium]
MQCPQCQATNREQRRFCGECGAPLPVVCPDCAFANDSSEKFSSERPTLSDSAPRTDL